MSGCNDKRFENMLHAYELNLLDEKEQFEFEVHLYKCSSCFEKVERFQKTTDLLRHSRKVRDAIEKISRTGSAVDNKAAVRKRLWPTLVPISIVAIFFIFLILKDWQFDIQPSKEAIAANNRLAIMYFNNLTDPDDSLKLGEIATNLLITDLSESQYLNIVSSQRLSDILGLLDQEGVKNISNNTASQIADEVDAKWILTGNILQTSPDLIVTTQLIEVGTGDVLASQKIEGNSDDDIFSVIDKLTIQIKNDLSLPFEALLEPDPQIADYTTHSPLAYRHYLEGIENYNKMYFNEAQADFEIALKYDSTFAMAYYYLAHIKDNLAHIKDKDLIIKALEYADGASTIDRLYIKIFEASRAGDKTLKEKLLKEVIKQYPDEKNAYYLLGILKHGMTDYPEAIDNYSNAIKIDPQFKMAYNQIAYSYSAGGDFERALWAIDKYIELAPDEANPFDTKADIYALNGMLDNAIESYKRALTIKPDFYASLKNLSLMYMFDREYIKADSCLNILISVEDTNYRESAYKFKCHIPLFQGKYDEAIKTIDKIIATSKKDSYSYHLSKSLIYMAQKDWTLALKEIEKTIELHDIDWPEEKAAYRYFRIHILAEGGNIERAAKLTEKLKAYVEESGKPVYSYWYAEGAIAMVQGDYDKALISYEKAKESNSNFFINYMLATVYSRSGRFEESILEFEQLSNSFGVDRAYFTIWSTKLYYHLGLAYEQTGQFGKAIEQYSIFLDIWKNADEGIEEINDARNRLARMQNQS